MAREGDGNTIKIRSVGAGIGALLFSALFAVVFGLGGYHVGLKPLVHSLQTALQVRGWHPVQAEVLSVQLKTHRGSEGPTYEAQTRYRYQVAGKDYESTRVGLDALSNSDNIDDWHRQWVGRLQTAQAAGQRITVWVNPDDPSQSLIDRSVRWSLQIFRLPFALVFTGVGLVAAWFFLRTLLGLFKPADSASEERGSDFAQAHGFEGVSQSKGGVSGGSSGAIWLFTIFWCGIAFPMAALFWTTSGTPWFAKAFISIFVVVGLALLAFSVRQTYLGWRYAGSSLTTLPSHPRAGHPVEVTLLLPARAAATYPQGQGLQLRLAHYRVDESSSGSPERCVESFTEVARVQPTADGGLRLVARFAVPPDAPPHGSRRSGERVDWRVEMLPTPGGTAELSYELPVQAAQHTSNSEASSDRFDRRAAWKQVVPIVPLSEQEGAEEEIPLVLPPSVTLQESSQAWQYEFTQSGWRWAAGLVLAGLALEAGVNGRLGIHGLLLPRGVLAAVGWTALVAFALHAATRRWTLTVHDEGITACRHSWLWSRADLVPGDASRSLVHKLLYSTGSGASEQRYHAVYARDAAGALVRLTPGLGGEGAATTLGQSVARAWSHRRGRFAAGMQRSGRVQHSRPALGALVVLALVAWWFWVPAPSNTAHRTAAAEGVSRGAAESATSYSAVDERLLDAQDAGDATALRGALAEGANPNLLAPNGSSMLMLAAHRGQLEHIDALLSAGAQPDLRQTQKDSERGDTALLRAFYGGHLAAARRLVQAGASLAARNRWDWGAVHMAAQSGCVPCLQWLAEQGQSLDEPAPASRGETPAMLAAAKGRVQALEWFELQGVDLWRKDPHGKNALDWARFGQQQEAERWLAQRQR